MSGTRPLKVLILCTGNSARSILAEYLLRRIGGQRFESFSAGSAPKGEVHPLAIQILRDVCQIDASDARSKSMDEYRNVDFDFVITVCDNARESCPIWPGRPVVLHWGMDDPAAVEGTDEEKLQAFQEAARLLERRLELFCGQS
jgi:arsenate reductase